MFRVYELAEAAKGNLISGLRETVVKGISIDSRRIKRGEAFVAIKGDNFDGHDFIREAVKNGAACIIAEKWLEGIKGPVLIRVNNTIESLGKIAQFNRNRYDIPVIAVTGSSGKTTTKDMLARVLSQKFKVLSTEGTRNNHIGLPLTLLKLDRSYGAVVLEIGTNHFGEVEYLSRIASANIAVITNIGPSHLKYFENLDGVFREKRSLLRSLKNPAIAVLNSDDRYLRKELLNEKTGLFTIGVGIKHPSDFTASCIRYVQSGYSFKVNRRLGFALTALGYYNIYNCLVSIAIARIFGIGYRKISAALSSFKPPSGRLSIINKKGIRFIDDSYNSNPLSLGQALDLLGKIRTKGRKVAVIGDMLELGGKAEAMHVKAVKEALLVCDTLITVGTLSSAGARGIRAKGKNIITCESSLQARKILFEHLRIASSDIVLVKGSRRMKMEEVFNL